LNQTHAFITNDAADRCWIAFVVRDSTTLLGILTAVLPLRVARYDVWTNGCIRSAASVQHAHLAFEADPPIAILAAALVTIFIVILGIAAIISAT